MATRSGERDAIAPRAQRAVDDALDPGAVQSDEGVCVD
jgi:hypothetical protein